MDAKRVGEEALNGWRGVVGPRVARTVASRTSLSEDKARAAIGLVYVALSVVYLVRTLARARRA